MEFNEKLQELRKQRGLTQEELSGFLFVSRTAISKWESGRGYPSIDSLKAISKFFGVTIDELLSGDELLSAVEEDTRKREMRLRDLVFGLLDCSAAMFFFLPFFGQTADGGIAAVSLLSFTATAVYLRAAYFAAVVAMIGSGLAILALQNCSRSLWVKHKGRISLGLNAAGVLLFIIGRQPYAAAFLFVFLVIKGALPVKRR